MRWKEKQTIGGFMKNELTLANIHTIFLAVGFITVLGVQGYTMRNHNPNIQGAWVSECQADLLTTVKVTMYVKDSKIFHITQNYSDAECKDPMFTVQDIFTINSISKADNGWNLTFSNEDRAVAFNQGNLVDVANDVNNSFYSNWKVNEYKIVTNRPANPVIGRIDFVSKQDGSRTFTMKDANHISINGSHTIELTKDTNLVVSNQVIKH